MNAHEHLPVDDLAAYAAGDLDATASVAVEAHLVLCADCRSDVEAITNATAALSGVTRPVMPADVAARIDAALAAERATAPAGDVLPLVQKRRRPSLAGIAAVAAAVALVAAISVPVLTRDSNKGATLAKSDVTTRRLTSGLDYTHATLAATLNGALSGRTSGKSSAGGVQVPGAAPAPSTAADSGAAPELTSGRALNALANDSGRLAACLTSLATGLPPDAATPLVLDFGTWSGKPATIVVFATVSQGQVRADKVDVFVVGPQCGVVAGDDDVLDFERIPRPEI